MGRVRGLRSGVESGLDLIIDFFATFDLGVTSFESDSSSGLNTGSVLDVDTGFADLDADLGLEVGSRPGFPNPETKVGTLTFIGVTGGFWNPSGPAMRCRLRGGRESYTACRYSIRRQYRLHLHLCLEPWVPL